MGYWEDVGNWWGGPNSVVGQIAGRPAEEAQRNEQLSAADQYMGQIPGIVAGGQSNIDFQKIASEAFPERAAYESDPNLGSFDPNSSFIQGMQRYLPNVNEQSASLREDLYGQASRQVQDTESMLASRGNYRSGAATAARGDIYAGAAREYRQGVTQIRSNYNQQMMQMLTSERGAQLQGQQMGEQARQFGYGEQGSDMRTRATMALQAAGMDVQQQQWNTGLQQWGAQENASTRIGRAGNMDTRGVFAQLDPLGFLS